MTGFVSVRRLPVRLVMNVICLLLAVLVPFPTEARRAYGAAYDIPTHLHPLIGDADGIVIGTTIERVQEKCAWTFQVEAWLRPLPDGYRPTQIELGCSVWRNEESCGILAPTPGVRQLGFITCREDGSFDLLGCVAVEQAAHVRRMMSAEYAEALIRAAQEPDGGDGARAVAIRHLGELRAREALALLIERAGSTDSGHLSSTRAAMYSLHRMEPDQAQTIALKGVAEASDPGRALLFANILCLGRLDEAVGAIVLEAARHWCIRADKESEAVVVAQTLVAALGTLPQATPTVESFLLDLIGHGSADIRVVVVGTASRLGLRSAVPPCFTDLADGEDTVRSAARGFFWTLVAKDHPGERWQDRRSGRVESKRALTSAPGFPAGPARIRAVRCGSEWVFRVTQTADGIDRELYVYVGRWCSEDGAVYRKAVTLWP